MNMSLGKYVKVWLKKSPKNGGGFTERIGKIVYIFPAFQIPNKELVIKYFGEMVIHPKYASQFGPNMSDRIVVEYSPDQYVILPWKGLGRYFKIEELSNSVDKHPGQTCPVWHGESKSEWQPIETEPKGCSFCGAKEGHHSAECVDTSGKGYRQEKHTRPDSKQYKYATVQETHPYKHPCDHEPAYNIGFIAGFNAARERNDR